MSKNHCVNDEEQGQQEHVLWHAQLELPLMVIPQATLSAPLTSAQVIPFKKKMLHEASSAEALRKILDFADSLAT